MHSISQKPGPNCPVVKVTGTSATRETCPLRAIPLVELLVFLRGTLHEEQKQSGLSHMLQSLTVGSPEGTCPVHTNDRCDYTEVVTLLLRLNSRLTDPKVAAVLGPYPEPAWQFSSGGNFAAWAKQMERYDLFQALQLEFEDKTFEAIGEHLFPYGDLGYWNKARVYFLHDRLLKGENRDRNLPRLLRLCSVNAPDKRNAIDSIPAAISFLAEAYALGLARAAFYDLVQKRVIENPRSLIETETGLIDFDEPPLVIGE